MSTPVWLECSEGIFYRVCAASPGPGPLAIAHRPTVVRQRGGALVVVSSSAGLHLVDEAAEAALGEIAEQLAEAGAAGDAEEGRAAIQAATREAHAAGRFGRGLPEVLAVVCGEDGARVWHAGPNGTGTSGGSGVRRLSADPRYAALEAAGLTAHGPFPTDPLAREVTGLTILESPWLELQGFVAKLEGGCILLMSKGALPFGAPAQPEEPATFWGRDAGWRHGLGATVVAVADEAGIEAGDRALDALRAAFGERAEPERQALAGSRPAAEVAADLEALALTLLGDPSPLIQARGVVMSVHLNLRALEPAIRELATSEQTFEGKGVQASLGRLAQGAARALNRYRADPSFPDWDSVAVGAPDIPPDEDRDDDADFAYLAGRHLLLSEVPPSAEPGVPFGVVMESGLTGMTHTMVVSSDGGVFSYRGSGQLDRGLGAHPRVRAAADELLAVAPRHWDDLECTVFVPRPAPGASRFLLLSPEEVRCTPELTWEQVHEVVQADRPIAPLIVAAHGVMTELSALEEADGDRGDAAGPRVRVEAHELNDVDPAGELEFIEELDAEVLDLLPRVRGSLGRAFGEGLRILGYRAALGRGPEELRSALRNVVELGVAIFRRGSFGPDVTVALDLRGTTVEVAGGVEPDTNARTWVSAACAALVLRDGAALDSLCAFDPRAFEPGPDRWYTLFAAGLRSLHRGDGEAERWVREAISATSTASGAPELAVRVGAPCLRTLAAVLCGDGAAFGARLVDELEEYRAFFDRPEQNHHASRVLPLATLAVCAVAHDRGMACPVDSPYLPAALVEGGRGAAATPRVGAAATDVEVLKLNGAPFPDGDHSGRVLALSLVDVDLAGAKLAGISPSIWALRCRLDDVDATGARWARSTLEACTAHRARFDGAELGGAQLAGLAAEEASFAGAAAESADLSRARLAGASFRGAKLGGASFEGADLRGCDFTGADLRRAWLVGADLRGARLDEAQLDGAELEGARWTD